MRPGLGPTVLVCPAYTGLTVVEFQARGGAHTSYTSQLGQRAQTGNI